MQLTQKISSHHAAYCIMFIFISAKDDDRFIMIRKPQIQDALSVKIETITKHENLSSES